MFRRGDNVRQAVLLPQALPEGIRLPHAPHGRSHLRPLPITVLRRETADPDQTDQKDRIGYLLWECTNLRPAGERGGGARPKVASPNLSQPVGVLGFPFL
ncbi:hypothetical protein RSP03_20280 [Cereibacter sphaeroides]|nr:hypothetical protein RSP03_20280 [Cereibacter sphaeroides]